MATATCETPVVLVIGHRGASAEAPENTPEAFALADRMGADGVELDVRLWADGSGEPRLVVHHDELPDDEGAVAAMPSFDEVLDACGERLLINVEIKNDAGDAEAYATHAVPLVIDAMRRRGSSWGSRFLISSFSALTVDACRQLAPEFATAALMENVTESAISRAAAAGHAAIHPWHGSATGEVVERAHAAGLAVNVWTANDPDDLVALADRGVDGACTDVPDIALDLLGRAGEPPAPTPRWARPA